MQFYCEVRQNKVVYCWTKSIFVKMSLSVIL